MSGEITITPEPIVPDILTQVSKERFRRRLLVGSRLIALALILVLVWWGWIQINYAKILAEDPCYACGYYYGKQCEPKYFTDIDIAAAGGMENLLKELGKHNSNYTGYIIKDRTSDRMFENINLSNLKK